MVAYSLGLLHCFLSQMMTPTMPLDPFPSCHVASFEARAKSELPCKRGISFPDTCESGCLSQPISDCIILPSQRSQLQLCAQVAYLRNITLFFIYRDKDYVCIRLWHIYNISVPNCSIKRWKTKCSVWKIQPCILMANYSLFSSPYGSPVSLHFCCPSVQRAHLLARPMNLLLFYKLFTLTDGL